ncbi:MAG: hypothetical protein ACI4FX_12450 [Agathobacter sp.]
MKNEKIWAHTKKYVYIAHNPPLRKRKDKNGGRIAKKLSRTPTTVSDSCAAAEEYRISQKNNIPDVDFMVK